MTEPLTSNQQADLRVRLTAERDRYKRTLQTISKCPNPTDYLSTAACVDLAKRALAGASCGEAACFIEQLAAVVNAARTLVAGARDLDLRHASVDEASLVALESALAAAGYDMTDEEFERDLEAL